VKEKEKMKKVLLTILAMLVLFGILAGAGFTGYRIGYKQGALTTSDGTTQPFGRERMPQFHPGLSDRGFNRGIAPYHSFMMPYGRGIGLFLPLFFLGRIALVGLAIWFAYWLFTRSGWRITRQTVKDQEVSPAKTEG
jgi:hypothetical protein